MIEQDVGTGSIVLSLDGDFIVMVAAVKKGEGPELTVTLDLPAAQSLRDKLDQLIKHKEAGL